MRRFVLIVLIAAMSIGTTAAFGGSARVDGEWIVVDHSDFDAGTGDIVMMRPDGSEPITFTSETEDTAGELSPDGTAIAFTSVDSEGYQGIWVMDVDGTGRHQVSEGFARTGTWTPDGMSIVYATGTELRIVGRNGADDRLIISAAEGESFSGPAVSPDGTTVAFAVSADNIRRLHTVGIAGGESTEITADSGFEPEWSSDGSRILFTTFRPESAGNIWATNPDGSEQENLVPSPSNDFNGTWSPDGSRVAFAAVRSGEVTISVYDRVDATTEHLLAAPIDGATYRRPRWTAVTLDAVIVAATTTTSAAEPTTTSTSFAASADTVAPTGASSETDWLVIGLVVAIVGLAAFGVGIVIGGRRPATPPPPPPPDID